jgi:RNA polymerase sigma-70 factor (ECF subfamily)
MAVVEFQSAKRPAGLIDLSPGDTLMPRAQKGDKQAYAEVLALCQRWLERYLSTRLAPDHVDDTVQEALLALHKKRHTYDPSRPFAPWFVAIARYKWLDRLRARYRAEDAELDDSHGVDSHEEAVLSRMVLERVLGQLPPAQARALTLAKLEGRSIEEIAQETGQSASLVKVNIHRARKKIVSILEKSYE